MVALGEKARHWWPSPAEMERLIQTHGTAAAVGRAIGRAPNSVARVLEVYGIEYDLHQADMPSCDVHFGWDAEDLAADLLGATVVRRGESRYAKYDLDWESSRVNVKAARPTRAGPPRGVGMGWSFNVARGKGHCDFYFCIGYDYSDVPERYLLIPANEAPASTLRIPLTFRTKWAGYEWVPD